MTDPAIMEDDADDAVVHWLTPVTDAGYSTAPAAH